MAHTGERICYTAETFIVHGNKVLLRMHDKYGVWLSVGGHIEIDDEDPTETAIREVKEEVGLWCTREDLETMDLLPDIKKYALAALEELAS